MKRIVVIGGGISGLSIAWHILRGDPSTDVVLLERGARTGGNIRTDVIDGYRCESGPDGFLDNAPDTLELVRQLGMTHRLQPSSDAARRRFIYRGSARSAGVRAPGARRSAAHLHEVPTGPRTLLTSRLLTFRAKARLACEPFGRTAPDGDESIHAFASRRIGREAASVMVDSMVSGIFAGDSRALSLRACFPKMYELERTYGSLVKALIATRQSRQKEDAAGAPAGRLTSFVDGMSELVDTLTERLGPAVRLSTPATFIRHLADGHWQVGIPGGTLAADAVVLAGPASEAATLIYPLDRSAAEDLNRIPTAPLAVVCLGYDAAAAGPLPGFGFLVPRSEGLRMLGTLWETSIYPNRAPAGKALLRVMIGGALDPEAACLPDAEMIRTVRDELQRTMGLDAVPEFVRIVRHRRGIPQYVGGHLDRLARIDAALVRLPGLHLAGNSYRGVSINNCIAEAPAIARAALASAEQASASALEESLARV
jgi:oxygen-dependent protoporphyrinogen oxidase